MQKNKRLANLALIKRWSMRFILFLLPILIFADTAQDNANLAGSPSSYIEGCVSAITGDLIIDQCDHLPIGAISYPLHRRYTSSESENPDLPYKILPHFYCRYSRKKDRLKIPDPDYLDIHYKKSGNNRYLPIKEKGSCNRPCQNIAEHHPEKSVIVHHPDGTKRTYRFFKKSSKTDHYIIETETLPSGARVHYHLAGELIDKITINAPTSHQMLSEVNIHYEHKEKPLGIKWAYFSASDGRELKYKLSKHSRPNKKKKARLLQEVISPIHPQENLTYNKKLKLEGRFLPEGRSLQFKYDAKGRVIRITGPNRFRRTIDYQDHKTITYDALGNKTIYEYGDDYRLTAIKYYQDTHLRTDHFKWSDKGELLYTRRQGKSKTFTYDELSNPTSETLHITPSQQYTIHRTYEGTLRIGFLIRDDTLVSSNRLDKEPRL